MRNFGEKQSSSSSLPVERFDFDYWKSLHEKSPVEFEFRRKRFLEKILATTSLRNRRRLHGILFQVEAIRQRTANPIKSCVDISRMMWEHFAQLNELLNDFENAAGQHQPVTLSNPISAKVIPFHPRS